MRSRRRLVVLLAATVAMVGPLGAGCASSAGVTGTAAPVTPTAASTASATPSAGSPSTVTPSTVTPSTATPSTATASTSGVQTAITVIPPASTDTAVPSTSAPAAASNAAASTPAAPVVTTTVVVTPKPATSTTKAPAPTTPANTPAKPGPGQVAGKVVVIDPGHNGANGAHPEIINQQVPAGFGQYKNCNTTGTQTNGGFPEYKFNWLVANYLKADLAARGITIVMTRDSDDGVGPCVNKRAAIGNNANADAVISIHGDGESAGIRGFYVMTSERPPAGPAMASQSTSLASAVRDGLAGAGLPPSNSLGVNGLWTRSDLAGLNLSLRPTVMIECGNMRNAAEAALMSSAAGQAQYARGIADGVLAYLSR